MPNWIGDFLMALAVVKRKAADPSYAVSLIIPEKLESLAFLVDDFPTLIYRRSDRKAFANTLREVKEGEFKTLFILPHSFSSAYFGFRTGVKRRRGIRAEGRSILLSDRVAASHATRHNHLTCEYSRVLETEYVPPDRWRGVSFDSQAEFSSDIVLCPGAAFGPAKKWPHYAELVKLMPERRFTILGNARDRAEGERIASLFPGRVKNIAGQTTLKQAFSIIASASAVVANDSGLMHAAGYLGTPVAGIYGSTSPVWTRPLGRRVRIAAAQCGCSPCFKRECSRSGDQYVCQESIPAERVVRLLGEMV
ncbi:MAG: lipopolysaccharide heptosyltransferase II [Chitinispirillaceae bacterium]